MKRTLKKVTAMILAGIMTVNMSIGAWADESNQSVLNTDNLENISNETAKAIPNTVKQHLSALMSNEYDNKLSRSKNNTAEIGNAIPVYEINGQSIEKIEHIKYYPVYISGELVGILTDTEIDGGHSFSYSYDLAEKINNKLSENQKFCFLCEPDILYLYTNNELSVLMQYNNAVVHKDLKLSDSLFETAQYKAVADEITLNDPSVSTLAVGDSKVLNVPTWNQTVNGVFYGLCWAGAAWAVGVYKTGITTYTPFTIADKLGIGYNTGAFNKDVINGLKLYGLSSYSGVTATSSQIKYYIDNDMPIIMSLQTSTKGHNLTIKGYNQPTSDVFTIVVMDTYGGVTRGLSSTNGTYTLTIGSAVYEWKSGVYLS